MKDNFLSANTPPASQTPPASGDSLSVYKSGMRHSIRPRRVAIETADKKDQEESLVAPYDSHVAQTGIPQQWRDLRMQDPGELSTQPSAMPVFEDDRDSSAGRAFDLLRTRLRHTTQEHGWTNIAVAAPTSGCGNTFTAVNLALSLSRITGSRTVLMDFNMRTPGVAAAFDMQAPGAISDYLDGSVSMADHMVRCSDTLALGLNSDAYSGSAETLQHPTTLRTLNKMHASLKPDIIIYDMPPMLAYDDVSAFLPCLDGVLLVSDGTQTTARQLTECEQMLNGEVPLLGVVLNRARKSSVKRYN